MTKIALMVFKICQIGNSMRSSAVPNNVLMSDRTRTHILSASVFYCNKKWFSAGNFFANKWRIIACGCLLWRHPEYSEISCVTTAVIRNNLVLGNLSGHTVKYD